MYQLIQHKLYHLGPDNVLHHYVRPHEFNQITTQAHEGIASGHMELWAAWSKQSLKSYKHRLKNVTIANRQGNPDAKISNH